MRSERVQVEFDDGWYVAQGLEDSAVITQGRSLDEIVDNVREVMELLHGVKQVQIELILPASLRVAASALKRRRKVKRTAS